MPELNAEPWLIEFLLGFAKYGNGSLIRKGRVIGYQRNLRGRCCANALAVYKPMNFILVVYLGFIVRACYLKQDCDSEPLEQSDPSDRGH